MWGIPVIKIAPNTVPNTVPNPPTMIIAIADIVNEIDRYISWPGQALAYKIGQLKILELRRKAEQILGDDFDVKTFHDELLGGGALPMQVLETRMNRWLTAELAKKNN